MKSKFLIMTVALVILVGGLAVVDATPVVNHVASSIMAGTFDTGNFTFPDSLKVVDMLGIGSAPTVSLQINDSIPEFRIIDSDENDQYTRITRTDTDGEALWKNWISYPPVSPGNALLFDGTNEYVTFGNIADFERNESFSIEAWINTSSATSQDIISKRKNTGNLEGYELQIGAAGKIYVVLCNDNAGHNRILESTSTSGFNDGNWHHIVMTYDGSSTAAGLKVYVDGTERVTAIVTDALSASIKNNAILSLASRDGVDKFFNGEIDEARVYDVELSQADVTAHYGFGIGQYGSASEDGIYGGWHLDESVGTTASDYSTNGRDGTTQSMEDADWVAGKVLSGNLTDLEVEILSSRDGFFGGEKGIISLGDTEGTVKIKGHQIEFEIDGSNIGNFTSNGNFNVSGNFKIDGCIIYNCSGTCSTLGDCV